MRFKVIDVLRSVKLPPREVCVLILFFLLIIGVASENAILNQTCFYHTKALFYTDNWDETFKDGDFADFIKPIVDTLDFYHNSGVDPRVICDRTPNLLVVSNSADIPSFPQAWFRAFERWLFWISQRSVIRVDPQSLHRHGRCRPSSSKKIASPLLPALFLLENREA
jgi:hypothetical protein